MKRDIVVFAGTTRWSVLSLCRTAYLYGAKAYCICVGLSRSIDYKRSKYVAGSYNVDPKNLESFWENFFQQHKFLEKPILFTTYDNACLLVDDNRSFYENHFVLCLPSSKIIREFNDKSLAGEAALKNGFSVPKTITIDQLTHIEIVCNSFRFPVIVKPTTASEHIKMGFKMKVFEECSAFKRFSDDLLHKGCTFVCQEYINGGDKDYKFYIFYRNEEGVLMECMGEKTLQSNGIMTIGTTKWDNNLEKQCKLFLERINYIGIGGIEVKKQCDEYYFIEMSTRTEGFIAISDMAGVSLAEAAFLDCCGESWAQNKQSEGVKYVVLPSLIQNRKSNRKYFRLVLDLVSVLFNKNSFFVNRFFKEKALA